MREGGKSTRRWQELSDGKITEFLDTAHSAQITDHPYVSSYKNIFVCDTCGLGQATHNHPDSQNYHSEDIPYRCPDCVHKRVDPCPHQKISASADTPSQTTTPKKTQQSANYVPNAQDGTTEIWREDLKKFLEMS